MKRTSPRSAARAAPTLRETQDSLQSAILYGDDAILASLLDNSRTTRSTLFCVYRNAYTGRLVEILMKEYPLLREHVGGDRFSDLARAYIAAHPSRTQNARWFGAALPAFLGRYEAAFENPELAELAGIEKAVSDAFDSIDAPVLKLSDLAKIPPQDWAQLTFRPHPSAILIRDTTNAFAIWKSLKDGDAPAAAVRLADPESVIIWRQGLAPMVRVMPYEEAMMWTEASRGVSFDALCTMLATFEGPDGSAARAAGYLQGWMASELLNSAEQRGRPVKAETTSPRREAVPLCSPSSKDRD